MTRMPEAAPQSAETPDGIPAFFRLGPVNNARVKDVLHHIQKNGMEDPRSTHQLLSLFRPEEFTADTFHVLSSNGEPKTLWDQVAEAASNPGKLTTEQKGTLASLKYFALQSLAEDPQEHVMRGGQTRALNEEVRDAAKTELQDYEAYLAKTLDPENVESARFFDGVNVVGRVAGKTAKVTGVGYLLWNLLGCSFRDVTPTISPDVTPPAITEIVPGIPTPSLTEVRPTPTPAPYTTEAAPGVQYGPPSLSDAAFHEGSGGSARGVVLEQTRMDEADLVAYENAAYEGAARSGFSRDQLELVYLYDETHGQWNMVLKLTDGRYLWSQKISDGAYSTFPLQLTILEGGRAVWNMDYALVPVPDSAGAEPFYTSGGYVELKGGTHVAIGADTYYSLWFNTLTGQWEAVAEVQAALQTSPPDIWGLVPTLAEFPAGVKADIPKYIAYLRSQPSLLTPGSPAAEVGQIVGTPPGASHFTVNCNWDEMVNCAPAAAFQFYEQVNGKTIDPHIIIWEIRNSDGSRGYMMKYHYDSTMGDEGYEYPQIVADPTMSKTFTINTGVDPRAQERLSYIMFLLTQPGFMDAVQQWIATGIMPPELENMIIP